MNYWTTYSLIFIIGLAALVTPLLILRQQKSTRPQPLVENLLLALLSLFISLMGLEFYFRVFFAQPDGFRFTLASRNWYDRYWHQNSLGYRDVEWTPEKLVGKTKVMVVGDSFVAGNGIANPADRFPDRLGQLLGDEYAILNVASPGWDTAREMRAVRTYPYRPDVIILSYHINDIKGAAFSLGMPDPKLRRDPPAWLAPLVEHSYAANFVYWRLFRLGLSDWSERYWNEWMRGLSEHPEVSRRHRQELLEVIEGTAAEQIPLVVVIFPHLAAVDETQFLVEPVAELFRAHNVPVLDVSELLADREPATTTVNAVDAHPNETIHREVAKHIYRIMIETEITSR